MNGNDGTTFDWKCNGRCCEFFLFYKETEYGFIKVLVNKDDTMDGYVYLNKGYEEGIHLEKADLNNGEALYLASLLQLEADDNNIWNATIDKINFNRKLELYELLSDNENEEDEEW